MINYEKWSSINNSNTYRSGYKSLFHWKDIRIAKSIMWCWEFWGFCYNYCILARAIVQKIEIVTNLACSLSLIFLRSVKDFLDCIISSFTVKFYLNKCVCHHKWDSVWLIYLEFLCIWAYNWQALLDRPLLGSIGRELSKKS